MDAAQIAQALEDVCDQAIVFHAYADYMRDYDIFIYATADPRTGIPPEYLRYRFKYCVRATATTALTAEIWARSLDERLVDNETGRDMNGYVWGVRWQNLYPGATLRPDSEEASTWSRQLGLPFYEAMVETNGHNLSLIFSDLEVAAVPAGLVPFVVPLEGGLDFKIPLP
ncbi:hypothetical protein ACIP5Y_26195 [Nocardia sp. NPDC088792]|uniref:YxiG-like protein n=1 Tax=Nocardia sp. NPDC088792 TaxID=3364332 RepID=UPI0037F88B19